MKSKLIGLACIILLIDTGMLQAQDKMNLKQIIDYALINNQNVKKAQLEIENGRLKKNEVRAQALPQISGNATLTDNIIKPRFVLPGDLAGKPGENIVVETGTTWNSGIGISLNQQLFNQSVFTGLQAAKLSEDFYELSAEATEEQIIEIVAGTYYQLLVNKEQLKVLDANLKSIQQLHRAIEAQYENGLVKKTDRDRVKVNLTNTSTLHQELSNGILQLENTLKYYMGMPIQTAILFESIDLSGISTNYLKNITEEASKENLTQYKLLKKQEQLLNLQKKVNVSEYFPSLSLSGNYSYNGLSDNFDLFTRNNTTAFWYDMASVGLTLRIPIFDGNARGSRVSQSKIELRKIEQDLSSTEQSLNLAYQNAKIRLDNSIQTIGVQEQNVALANEVYQTTQTNYEQGISSLTDLLNSETARVDAQNSYNRALLNYKLAEIELLKSKGQLRTLNQ